MTHGLADIGSEYDVNGNLLDWWKEEAREKYIKKVKCIIKQYANYTDKKVGMKVCLFVKKIEIFH